MAYINKINVDGVAYEVKDENALPAADLPEAINTALAQAKESGEFDGAQGPAGPAGNDYTLTEADKQEIAELAADLVPSGGGSDLGTVDETLLASGTIANETGAQTYSNTGLTMGDLRKWKMFGAYIIAAQSTHWGFHAPDYTCRFSYQSGQKVRWIFEWVDNSKTALRVYFNRTSAGYENLGFVNAKVGSTIQAEMELYGVIALVNVADTTAIKILNYDALTGDATWTIKGVIK